MTKINEKVATENAQIFRMVVLEMIGDNISTCSELTATPNKRVGEIKEVWSLERLIQGFDMDNANISEDNSSLCINAKHTEDNVSASLAISWEELTDNEMELIKKMFN